MNVTLCDICKHEVNTHKSGFLKSEDYKIKIKKQYCDFGESGWHKLTICENCQNNIISILTFCSDNPEFINQILILQNKDNIIENKESSNDY